MQRSEIGENISKRAEYKIPGPTVVTEMESNLLISPVYTGEIDSKGLFVIKCFHELD